MSMYNQCRLHFITTTLVNSLCGIKVDLCIDRIRRSTFFFNDRSKALKLEFLSKEKKFKKYHVSKIKLKGNDQRIIHLVTFKCVVLYAVKQISMIMKC
jgi:hypothetical protein